MSLFFKIVRFRKRYRSGLTDGHQTVSLNFSFYVFLRDLICIIIKISVYLYRNYESNHAFSLKSYDTTIKVKKLKGMSLQQASWI